MCEGWPFLFIDFPGKQSHPNPVPIPSQSHPDPIHHAYDELSQAAEDTCSLGMATPTQVLEHNPWRSSCSSIATAAKSVKPYDELSQAAEDTCSLGMATPTQVLEHNPWRSSCSSIATTVEPYNSVARKFRNGSSFERLLQDFRDRQVNPIVDLKPLKVYSWAGRGFYSRDNRRLKCLKEYQQELGDVDVYIRVNVLELPSSLMDRIARSPQLWGMLRDANLAQKGQYYSVHWAGH